MRRRKMTAELTDVIHQLLPARINITPPLLPSPCPSPNPPHPAQRTYGTTQTGSTSKTTPTHPLATTGPMNKSSVTAKPGQSCRIEFTPSEHVRAPVAMLQTTGVSLPSASAGGSKRRSWRPVLVGWGAVSGWGS